MFKVGDAVRLSASYWNTDYLADHKLPEGHITSLDRLEIEGYYTVEWDIENSANQSNGCYGLRYLELIEMSTIELLQKQLKEAEETAEKLREELREAKEPLDPMKESGIWVGEHLGPSVMVIETNTSRPMYIDDDGLIRHSGVNYPKEHTNLKKLTKEQVIQVHRFILDLVK